MFQLEIVSLSGGTVVNKNIPSNSVAVGNPVRVIGSVDDYIEKNKALMNHSPVFHTYWKDKSFTEIEKMKQEITIGTMGYDI